MRIIAIVGLALSLQGCFFVYVPGSVIDAVGDKIDGVEGDNCVGPAAKVGDRVRLPAGGFATIVSLSGVSERCKQPEMPVRAKLTPTAS
jgi:hypothetical protein